MSRAATDPLEDTGLDASEVARSLVNVFAGVCGVAADAVTTDGWPAVVKLASATFGFDDDDGGEQLTLSVSQLASQFRRAFARATSPDAEVPPFEQLALKGRLAWEAVVRHAGNIYGMDRREAGRLGEHEAKIVAMMLHRLGTP